MKLHHLLGIGVGLLGAGLLWLALPGGAASSPPTAVTPTVTPAVSPDAAPAAPSAPTVTATPPPTAAASQSAQTSGHVVGSEGYGPQILVALDGGDGPQALAAARLLAHCASPERVETMRELLRGAQPQVQPGTLKDALEADRLEARRCQTVTPAMQARRLELAQRAHAAGVPGAAAAMAQALTHESGPESERAVAGALAEAVQRGDASALEHLAWNGRLQMGEVERRAYRLAAQDLPNPGFEFQPGMRIGLDPRDVPPLAAPAEAQAQQLAGQLRKQCCKR